MSVLASILSALGAALAFAVAAVLQQEAARRVPRRYSGRLVLLVRLLHQPIWLGGVSSMLVGYGLQALALALGPVALVQPIVIGELAFAIPVGMARARRSPQVREWVGIAGVVVGVTLFLLAARPAPGSADPTLTVWIAVLVPTTGVVSSMLIVARRSHGPARPVLLGAAAGICFGLVAVLTKATIHQFGQGVIAGLGQWEPYILVVVGIVALICSQSAYQAGPLAYSMPMVGILEPASAVIVGTTALGEHIKLADADLAVAMFGSFVAIVGIILLARSPLVHSIYQVQERDGGEFVTNPSRESEESTRRDRVPSADDARNEAYPPRS